MALIVNGFVRDVLQQLPMEFMAETQKLIGISLEGRRWDDAASGSGPRRHGYGATPGDWQGLVPPAAICDRRVVVGAYLPLVAGAPSRRTGAGAWRIAAWALVIAVLTLASSAARVRRPMDNGTGAGESRSMKCRQAGAGSQPGPRGGGVNDQGAPDGG